MASTPMPLPVVVELYLADGADILLRPLAKALSYLGHVCERASLLTLPVLPELLPCDEAGAAGVTAWHPSLFSVQG